MIKDITIITGHGRDGSPETEEEIKLNMGELVSVVGPTGSGKTTLINDIELFADGDTPTGRRILINGERPPRSYREDPAKHPIALITQHTSFLSDLPVTEFLRTHATIRGGGQEEIERLVRETIEFANQLTGEPVNPAGRMTELSGGQTRALLVADASVICDTPVVLLDEVENAGIHRTRALELLRRRRKIFIFVTHDPRIALLSDRRIVMKGGRICHVLHTDESERKFSERIGVIDELMGELRDKIRHGGRITEEFAEAFT